MTPAADPASEEQRVLLERYLDLLYADSNRLNLTRVPRGQAWARHIDESLDLLPVREWTPGECVLDLGSGGGVPGIPLAIAQPGLLVGLVERDLAKAAFLRDCLGQLGLSGAEVLPRDARELRRSEGFVPADVVVSRAALPAPQLFRTATPLLRPGGEVLAHVGATVTLDADLLEAARRAGVGELRMQTSGRSRLLRFVRGRS